MVSCAVAIFADQFARVYLASAGIRFLAMSISPAVQAQIKEWLAAAAAGDGLVKHMGLCYEKLEEIGMLTRGVRIPCKSVGVHPKNRDGLGVNSDHVWELLVNIADLGFQFTDARAIVVELGNDAEGTAARKFNTDLVAKSMGKLLGLVLNVFSLFP